ncbi:GNAT family N-acetyltransferase [Cupriavidus basilensis]|uniref:GNAT family N-acetyltransferase n=1 Tax=Cupriavidus basilensis TaxID=68895 RepID=A0ABT6B4D5_9BURK|nr:GNAT family N-acetyltransferase [Cupriavidus basilensis]MDF3839673.1 GNAT family N-acetyltransferase [Cupriavidus basilensis]
MSEYILRPMRPTDLPAVLEIQARCYRDILLESGAALASRLALSPATCWVAAHADRDEALAAYLFTHMWPQDSLPPLDGVLERHWDRDGEPAALTWFVHDMAVAPDGQGKGLAQSLYQAARLAALATGLDSSRLIAVQSAAAWWRRLGYENLVPVGAALSAKLSAYGDDAVLMCRTLQPA